MIIREIKPSDNALLGLIIKKVFKELNLPLTGSTYEDPEISNLYKSFMSSNKSYFVFEESGAVLGGARIGPLLGADNKICEFQMVYLNPQSRGKGYGEKLLDKCLINASQLGYKQCYLKSGPELKAAIQLYANNGFERLKATLGNNGDTACGVWIIKDL